MLNNNDEIDDKIIKHIDKKLMEVDQDDANGVKWLTREEVEKHIIVNNNELSMIK